MRRYFFKQFDKTGSITDDFWREHYQGGLHQAPVEDKQVLGKKLTDKRILAGFVVALLGLCILFGKAVYLQAVQGEYYAHQSENNRTNTIPLRSTRGVIFDARGKQLVTNTPIFDAAIIPKNLPFSKEARDQEIEEAATMLDIPISAITDELDKRHPRFAEPITIKENISYDEAIKLKIETAHLPSISIETRNKREYADAKAFAHLIGYEGKITDAELASRQDEDYLYNDRIGKTGLELSYEQALRGTYGVQQVEVNVQGVQEKTIATVEPVSGSNLVLSIDAEVQNKVRDILNSYLKRLGLKRASVILEDPSTGEIKAMVTTPDFDNNLFAQGISQEAYAALINDPDHPLFNRSIKGEYPSGSTIKEIVGAAALEEGIITPRTTFTSVGGIWVANRWFFPDWKAGGHGATNIYRAIAWSVNTFFYIVGGGYDTFQGLGEQKLAEYFVKAGLGHKSGIDLPGEATGLVPTPQWKEENKNEEWYIGDTYHMAIGQGDVLVTPLQVTQYTSIFANGGTLYKPHVVKEIISGTKRTTIEPEVIDQQVFSPETVQVIRQAMRQTITDGSAEYMGLLPVTSAGKTGTAQWHPTKKNHAWYTGFAPYDKPELAFTVLVEEGDEGSTVSVPIAFDILNWYFTVYKHE